MGICWHDCSRIQPDIDVSKNAICTIYRGWMAETNQNDENDNDYDDEEDDDEEEDSK